MNLDAPSIIGIGLTGLTSYLSLKYLSTSRQERKKAEEILSQRKLKIEDLIELGDRRTAQLKGDKLGSFDGSEELLKRQMVCGYLNSSTPLQLSKEDGDCLLIIETENREALADKSFY